MCRRNTQSLCIAASSLEPSPVGTSQCLQHPSAEGCGHPQEGGECYGRRVEAGTRPCFLRSHVLSAPPARRLPVGLGFEAGVPPGLEMVDSCRVPGTPGPWGRGADWLASPLQLPGTQACSACKGDGQPAKSPRPEGSTVGVLFPCSFWRCV